MTAPRYRIEGKLGDGGSGTVWRAREAGGLGRVVALKRLPPGASPEHVARLREEAATLAELHHNHIVRVFDVVEDDSGVAVAMQYAAGGSLEDLIVAAGSLPPARVVRMATEIAAALGSAHRRRLVHGDVKPTNILFDADGAALLADFGACRPAGAAHNEAPVEGTAEYLDPDVRNGAAADPRSDVYALGVVCYEALTGRLPFEADTVLGTLRAADRGEHVPLAVAAPHVPPAVAEVIERAMARRRSDRWADGDAFAAALGDLAAVHGSSRLRPHVTPSAGPRGTRSFGPRPPHPPRATNHLVATRSRIAVIITVALAALAVGALVITPPLLWHRRPPTQPTPRPVWDGRVLTVVVDGREQQYEIGRPGDKLLFGDWDCRGGPTPALYRPSTGRLFEFDAWPSAGRPLAEAAARSAPPNARPRVVHGPGTCDQIVFR